ncbi:MAG TPA: RHS repeat-associated core domain-containing protein [Casimicrobiaceae bacterium]|nr:RHS repeat-associated core domain-containing protein [Casimicrobiaceae bacterium]
MASFLSSLRSLCIGLAGALAFAMSATAATPSVGVALDTDSQSATGCTVPTANGALAGIELVVTARTVTTATGAYVDRVERQTCTGGILGSAVVVDSGDWPVGFGVGTGGSAVVEMSIPRTLLPSAGVAKAVAFANDGGSGADATAPFSIVLAREDGAGAKTVPVPLSPWLALPLALLVAWIATRWMRRHPERVRIAGVLFVFAFAGLAWAASIVRDGAIGDWAGVSAAAGDPAGDGVPDADIVAVFVQDDDAFVHLRIDADLRVDGGGSANAAPSVSAGANQSVTLPAGAALAGSASDDGLPNPPGVLTTAWTFVSGPASVAFANPAATSTTATFTAPGTYVLRLTANDGELSTSATTTVTVQDGPPQLAAIADRTIELGTRLQIVLEAKEGNAGDALVYSLPTAPAGASLAPPPLVDWMPTAAQLGTHPFTARVTDSAGGSASRSFNVTVVHTNHAPSLAPQASEVVRGGATFVRRLVASDPDSGDTLTFTIVAGPPGMTISGSEITWPTAGAAPGDRTVTVRVRDAAGLASQGSFTLTLLPAAAPVAVDDEFTVRVGETLVVPAAGVLANDQNPSGAAMSAVKKTDPALGTLSALGADGSFTFVAPASPPAAPFGLAEAWRNDASGQIVNSFPVVGDVNGDGYPDLVLSSQFVGHRAVDLRTGATLWNIDQTGYADCGFGFATSNATALADVDDDGVPEYVGNLGQCERDSAIDTPGYAPADRIFALDGRTGAIKWMSERISRPLGDVRAPGTPPSTEDRYQHVYAGAQYASMHVARLAAGAAPTILFRQTLRADAGYYQPVSGPARSTGCRALTGLAADDNVACRATILMRGDGSVESILTAPNPSNMSQASWDPMRELAPFTVDVDGDGAPEIVSGSDVWKKVGGAWTLLWQSEIEPIQALAADLDGDDRPEIVHVLAMDKTGSGASPRGQYGGDLYKFNGLLILDGATGVEKRRIRLPVYWTAWLTIADLDDDGAPEFVWNTQGRVYAFGTDGRIRWTYAFVPDPAGNPPDSYSGTANVQVYDLDGDGVPEVVTNSHTEIVVLNGRTGAVRASHPSSGLHGGFYHGHNVQLVDADADGHVDIVATNVSGPDRLSYLMLRGAPNTWLPGPKVHPQVNFVNGDFTGNGRAAFNAGVPTQFRNPAQQGTVGDPRATEGTSFTYAIDGVGGESAPATVFVAIKPANLPPVITSTPPTGLLQRFAPNPPGGLVTNYYQPTAIDPDAGDTLTWSLVSAPVWVTMEPGGRIRFEPTCGSYGYPCGWGWTFVVLRVTDSLGAYAEQSFMVNLTTTGAAVPNVVGLMLADANAAVAAAALDPQVLQEVADASPAGTVLAQDPVAGAANVAQGATVNLTVSKGPQPVAVPFVVGKTLAQANAAIGALGLTTSVSTAFSPTVPAGDVMAQSPDFGTMLLPGSAPPVALTVSAGAPLSKPVAQVVVEPGPGPLARLVGETQAFKATAVCEEGTGANVTYSATWQWSAAAMGSVDATGTALAKTAGAATISATIGGKTGQANLAVSALAPGDATPPVASIAAPADGASVNGPVDVIGTATDPNFLRYELAFAPAGDETWTVIGEGTSPVAGGVLGTFDPTVLVNDLYTLRLRVFDKGENVSEASVTVQATGQRKVGLFTLSYTDLNIPSPGVPVTVTRTYDSRDKAQGDFGVGWRLGVQTLRLRTNRVLGTGWDRVVAGPTVSLMPLGEHRVSITLSDGSVEQFDLVLSPTSNLGSLDFTRVTGFTPRAGTLGTLEYLGNPDLLIVSGGAAVVLVDDATLDPFDPRLFRYTTVDGMAIEIDRIDGVRKVVDRNGNTVSFGPDGIVHSSGQSILFQRDAKRRIVQIVDPKGVPHAYAYDANGDLVSYTNASGAQSHYRYDREHRLIEIVDPSGLGGVRSEYDDRGRLVAMIDAAGQRIELAHDEASNRDTIRDRRGNATLIDCDADGNATRTQSPVTVDGTLVDAVTLRSYDGFGNETAVTDADGRRTQSTFDGVLPLKVTVDPGGLGLTTQLQYGPNKVVTRLTDAAGRSYDFGYDIAGNMVSSASPLAGTATAQVDARGLVVRRDDAQGNRTLFQRDGAGRKVREEVHEGAASLLRRTEWAYDDNGNLVTETLYRTIDGTLTPVMTRFEYDASNRLIAVIDATGATTRTEYDAAGRVVATVDALGRRTSRQYDALGRLQRTTFADGTTATRGYDPNGNLVSETDRGGRVTTHAYDELDRLVATTRPGGGTIRLVPSAAGVLLARIDERGHRTDFEYDVAGRLVKTTLPSVVDAATGNPVRPVETLTLNETGLPVIRTDPNGHSTSMTPDAQGFPAAITFADGSTRLQAIDALGRRTSVTNEEGQTTTFGYDALGRLTSVHGHAGDATYAYDEAGNLVAQTDALGRTTTFRYNLVNRLIERRFPNGDSQRYLYDAVGNTVASIDGLGRTTAFVYDEMNRLVRKTLPGGGVVLFTYQADGRLASVVDARGTTTYAYDARGRLAKVTDPSGAEIAYTHGADDLLLALASPGGSVAYDYDALGRLSNVTASEGSTEFGYDRAGNRLRVVAANGTVAEQGFDLRNRPTSLIHRAPGGAVFASFASTWSPSGRQEQIVEADGSVVAFTYDVRGRLVGEARTGSHAFTASHAYDAAGNRAQSIRNGVATTFTYDANDRLVSDGTYAYFYDANGNLTRRTGPGGPLTYGYDTEDRLVSYVGGAGAFQYQYDAFGTRVQATTPTQVTRFLVDTANPTGYAQVLEERDGAGALQARYTWGAGLLAQARAGIASFAFADGLGHVGGLTDAVGAVTDRYVYDAYGASVATMGVTPNPYRYGAERFDAESGLVHLRARQYDPAVARFLTRDPFAGRLESPISLHRYAYANDDPVNFRDPTGRESLVSLTVAQSINSTIEMAEVVSEVNQACNAFTTLGAVGYTVLATELAIGALGALANAAGFNAEIKTSFSIVGTNPATYKHDDIKAIDFRIEPGPSYKLAMRYHDKSSKAISIEPTGPYTSFSKSYPLHEFYKCNVIPVGSVSLKTTNKNWFGINFPSIPALSIEVSLLDLIRNEWRFFDGVTFVPGVPSAY